MTSRKDRYDYVVIGGGIVGITTAYYLSKRGASVALFEKGRFGGEQSSRNWGAVRAQGRDPAELGMMIECQKLWRGLERELEADISWRQEGQLRVAYNKAMIAGIEAFLPIAKQFGLDTRALTERETRNLLPHYAGGCIGAMFTSTDGCADPERVVPAFAAALDRMGTPVHDFCAVDRIEVTGNRVSGVVTERGIVEADSVIVAAGAWTSRLLRAVGVHHPSLWIRGSVQQTSPLEIEMRKLVVWGRCAYRQRPDGRVWLAVAEDGFHDVVRDSFLYGSRFFRLAAKNFSNVRFSIGMPLLNDICGEFSTFTKHRTLDPKPDAAGLRRSLERFRLEYPAAGQPTIEKQWAGYIDYMPDELPSVGPIGKYSGLFVAAGLSGHGFGLGPIVGKTMSQILLDGRSDFDLSPFRPERFS